MTGGWLPGSLLGLSLPDDLFAEIALILLVSALAGLVAVRLHQPVIVAFVAVGGVVGGVQVALIAGGAPCSRSRSGWRSRCRSTSGSACLSRARSSS